MTKDVEVSISGLQWSDETGEDNIENIVQGTYYKRNDSHYLLYEEAVEGFEQRNENRVKFRQDRVELIRKGVVNTQMIFEKNKTHMMQYKTPYGELLLGIRTDKMELDEQEDCIRVSVEYVLEMGDAPLSNNQIIIVIRKRP